MRVTRRYCILVTLAASMLLPSLAHGQTLGTAMCLSIFNNLGTLSAIASLGVILLGLGATLGKVTWKQAILAAVGISVMFGSVAIVQSIAFHVDVNGDGRVDISDINLLAFHWCPA